MPIRGLVHGRAVVRLVGFGFEHGRAGVGFRLWSRGDCRGPDAIRLIPPGPRTCALAPQRDRRTLVGSNSPAARRQLSRGHRAPSPGAVAPPAGAIDPVDPPCRANATPLPAYSIEPSPRLAPLRQGWPRGLEARVEAHSGAEALLRAMDRPRWTQQRSSNDHLEGPPLPRHRAEPAGDPARCG